MNLFICMSVMFLNRGFQQKPLSRFRPRPHVSGDFCIRNFFYAGTPSVHTCPPYTLGVSGDFCIRSPEWKFLYTLCIRIRVDARIRIFLYTLTSQYQNQSFSARDLTNPLRCPDTNRIRVDGHIRSVYATCGRRYFCIRIKKFADTCGRGLICFFASLTKNGGTLRTCHLHVFSCRYKNA